MNPDQRLATARRRANAKFGFLIHLAAFVAVNALLLMINLGTTPHTRWFPFPLGGWALGLTLHGLAVFWPCAGLREKLLEHELRRIDRRDVPTP